MIAPRKDAARRGPGVGVSSLTRLDDTTFDNRPAVADPFRCGIAADEGIVIARLSFDGKFAREHDSVIDANLFDDQVWRAVFRAVQDDLRQHGEVDPARIRRTLEAADPDRANARLADLVEYAQFEPIAAECALHRLIERRGCCQLADLCKTISDQVGTPSMSYAKAHELIGEHLDSFPAYKTLGLRETNWTPIPASELGQGVPVDWPWYGYLAAGHMTLLTGLWFAGKTTLIAHLLIAFEQGDDLAGAVTPGRVLVVSEESGELWKRRVDDLGIGDHVKFLIRPFMPRPTRRDWEQFIEHLAGLVQRHGYSVVIFDVLPHLWPVTNENDAAEVLTALHPLHRITEAGAAVLLVHHPRKSEGDQGQATRGSGALPGFVDIFVELRRFDPQRREDRRRVLIGRSRFDETPGEVVIELGDDGYRLVGTKAEASREDRMAVIEDLLPADGSAKTAKEVRASWSDGDVLKPGKRAIELDLQHGAKVGRWQQIGTGRRADPFRFAQPNTYRAARIESEGHEGPAT